MTSQHLQIGDDDDKRTKAVKELMNTELTYVSNLTSICEGLIKPLRLTGMLCNKSIASIFSNAETLLNFHRTFQSGLMSRVTQWSAGQKIGDLFVELTPYLKLYTQYCMNYDHAIATCQKEKEQNKPFAKFLAQAQDSTLGGAYITTYLIMPIQRIPRYEMLLGEILKHTPEEHPDLEDLRNAEQAVKKIADFVNKECIKAERMQILISIGAELGMEGLAKKTRYFIKRSTVEVKVAHTSSDPQPSPLILFNDLLLFTIPKKKSKNTANASVELQYCWIYEEDDKFMQVATMGATYLLTFANESERTEWFQVITDTTHTLCEENEETSKLRTQFSIMKVDNVFTVSSIGIKENELPRAATTTKKKRWLLDHLSGRTKKRSGSSPVAKVDNGTLLAPDTPANGGSRANTLLHSIDVSNSLLSSIPEVDVTHKRRSMPHISSNRKPLSASMDVSGTGTVRSKKKSSGRRRLNFDSDMTHSLPTLTVEDADA